MWNLGPYAKGELFLFYLELVRFVEGKEDHQGKLVAEFSQVREQLESGQWQRFVITELQKV
jgi:hypothetical protein